MFGIANAEVAGEHPIACRRSWISLVERAGGVGTLAHVRCAGLTIALPTAAPALFPLAGVTTWRHQDYDARASCTPSARTSTITS